MRIGIDTRHLSAGFGTGGRRVLENFIRAFPQTGGEIVLLPYNRFNSELWQSWGPGRMAAAVLADAVFKNLFLPFWCRIKNPDVLLHILPPISFTVRKPLQICYIFDVPADDDEKSLASMIYNNIYIKSSCKKADLLLTISQDAADQITRRYKVPPERIKVAYLCVDLDHIREVPPEALPPGRDGFFIGIISRINWRKNPGAYLETFRRLPKRIRSRYPLVLAGALNAIDDLKAYASEEILNEVRDDVICLGRVPDDALIGYIKSAKALLFPSNHEGFGLPILEAVACGTPAIASDIPVFKELFSEVASLYAPNDYDGMTAMMMRAIEGTGPRIAEDKRAKWLDQFSFKTHTKRMSQLLNLTSSFKINSPDRTKGKSSNE